MATKTACIGCGELSEDGLCLNCESKLNTLEAALKKAGTKLELIEVKSFN